MTGADKQTAGKTGMTGRGCARGCAWMIVGPILLYWLASVPFYFIENYEYGDREQIETDLFTRALVRAAKENEKVRAFVAGRERENLYHDFKEMYPRCCRIVNLQLAQNPSYKRGDPNSISASAKRNIFLESYFKKQWYVVRMTAPSFYNRPRGTQPDIDIDYYCNLYEYCDRDTPVGCNQQCNRAGN